MEEREQDHSKRYYFGLEQINLFQILRQVVGLNVVEDDGRTLFCVVYNNKNHSNNVLFCSEGLVSVWRSPSGLCNGDWLQRRKTD